MQFISLSGEQVISELIGGSAISDVRLLPMSPGHLLQVSSPSQGKRKK